MSVRALSHALSNYFAHEQPRETRSNLRLICDLFRGTPESREPSDDLDPQATLYVRCAVITESCFCVPHDERVH